MYGIYCLVIFFTTIIATYGALSEIIEHGATYKEVGLFVIVFYCMSLLFIICNEAHHASKRVRETMGVGTVFRVFLYLPIWRWPGLVGLLGATLCPQFA